MSTNALNHIVEKLRVAPGDQVDLAERSTNDTFGMAKESAPAAMADMKGRLDLLQQRLYAEGRRSVLLVFQAMDAAGKDGTIRNTLSGLNPAGVRVTSFKAPGGPEAAHDYLWRIHAACPARGEIGVFNRSHYEDVLVVRVKRLAPKSLWRKRYAHIRNFEQLLADEGTTVVKLYLNISNEEQRERLQDRVDSPDERWKFRLGDLDDRKLWPEYMTAFRDALERTSTSSAPWYVVPADRKWVRNLAVAKILRHTLAQLDPQAPAPEEGIAGLQIA